MIIGSQTPKLTGKNTVKAKPQEDLLAQTDLNKVKDQLLQQSEADITSGLSLQKEAIEQMKKGIDGLKQADKLGQESENLQTISEQTEAAGNELAQSSLKKMGEGLTQEGIAHETTLSSRETLKQNLKVGLDAEKLEQEELNQLHGGLAGELFGNMIEGSGKEKFSESLKNSIAGAGLVGESIDGLKPALNVEGEGLNLQGLGADDFQAGMDVVSQALDLLNQSKLHTEESTCLKHKASNLKTDAERLTHHGEHKKEKAGEKEGTAANLRIAASNFDIKSVIAEVNSITNEKFSSDRNLLADIFSAVSNIETEYGTALHNVEGFEEKGCASIHKGASAEEIAKGRGLEADLAHQQAVSSHKEAIDLKGKAGSYRNKAANLDKEAGELKTAAEKDFAKAGELNNLSTQKLNEALEKALLASGEKDSSSMLMAKGLLIKSLGLTEGELGSLLTDIALNTESKDLAKMKLGSLIQEEAFAGKLGGLGDIEKGHTMGLDAIKKQIAALDLGDLAGTIQDILIENKETTLDNMAASIEDEKSGRAKQKEALGEADLSDALIDESKATGAEAGAKKKESIRTRKHAEEDIVAGKNKNEAGELTKQKGVKYGKLAQELQQQLEEGK